MNIDRFNVTELTDIYLDTLLWSSAVGEDGDESADAYEPALGLIVSSREDVKDFLAAAGDLIDVAGRVIKGYNAVSAMHDFALTRNGHGAGFWDRGLGAVGEELTAIAKGFGSHEVYLGDDNLIHEI